MMAEHIIQPGLTQETERRQMLLFLRQHIAEWESIGTNKSHKRERRVQLGTEKMI